ncbi:MAG: SusD/RagB family nutrient-binding outer membrane lipoprotein [Bacteroidales bacterium]
MKKILTFCSCLLLMLALTSCNEWLDINDDPNNPNSTQASASGRLAWIQHHYLYAQMCAGTRASYITQQLTATSTATRDGMSSGWNPSTSMSTTPYQWWFVVSACNLKDLEAKAEAEEAWHYIGAAKAIHAMGFMLMTDWYGEMPYTEALGASVTPVFDDGKTIFEGCLATIDEAISYFERVQGANATPLSAGDSWNGGDVQKWIKMCYGMKARWLNNLSKKSSLYDPDAILAAIAKGPASNSDNTVVNHVDLVSDNVGDIMWADPLMTSIVFDCAGMNSNSRPTKWYNDLLENFDNKGLEDPRADKLIPLAQFGKPKTWVRSKGVDMTSDIRVLKGPMGVSYNAKDEEITSNGRQIPGHSWYINNADSNRWGDTAYVQIRSSSIGYNGDTDDMYKASDDNVLSTSTFYVRPDGPTHFMCYHEMCFIKAEVLYKKGDKPGAYAAYKEGVRAHMELMNQKLNQYNNENPGKTPMATADINNYINNALGTAADITLGKIMTQKFIAMSFQQQNWNDMRRYDYSANAYPNWEIPYEYYMNSTAQKGIPMGSQYRRIKQCSHEINYNSENLKASNAHALADDVWAQPVWWDIAE